MKYQKVGRFATVVAISLLLSEARGENLNDAWIQALRLNDGLQSREFDNLSAGMSLGASRSAWMPSLSLTSLDAFLSQSPMTRLPSSLSGAAAGAGASSFPKTFSILGPNQSFIPFVFANINQPIYQGGRIRSNIAASTAGLKFQKTEEFRTALDLKLTVAEAYVAILRARRNLGVARSNVAQLAAFLRDVTNRKNEGQATRNEELAAEVSLANAKLQEISARKNLESAWATYNRYLCRPPGIVVDLEEIQGPPPSSSLDTLSARWLKEDTSSVVLDQATAGDLTSRALRERPELRGLAERANQSEALASATMAAIKPQVSFNASYVDIGTQSFTNPNLFAGTFQLSWTMFDGGQTRKRAEAQRLQALSYLKQKADASADIALAVRNRMLDVDESRQRVIVSGAAVASANENIKVVTERYRQGLSIYTEVLDAESRRIQSLNGYYAATYDNALALFRLHRAVGDL
jgi:outer membrane protein TolC